jgi:Ras-related C3 botulinum toxin substrate 1
VELDSKKDSLNKAITTLQQRQREIQYAIDVLVGQRSISSEEEEEEEEHNSTTPQAQAIDHSLNNRNDLVDQMQTLLTCPIYASILKQAGRKPLLTDTFQEPVTTPKGDTYDKKWLSFYLQANDNQTPKNEKVVATDLVVNRSIQDIANYFRENQYIDENFLLDPILAIEFSNSKVQLTPYGHSYCDACIEQLSSASNKQSENRLTCPLTNQLFTMLQLRSNHLLKEICTFYKTHQKTFEANKSPHNTCKINIQCNQQSLMGEYFSARLTCSIQHLSQLIKQLSSHKKDLPNKLQVNLDVVLEALNDIQEMLQTLAQNNAITQQNIDTIGKITNSLASLENGYTTTDYREILSKCHITQSQYSDILLNAFSCLNDLVKQPDDSNLDQNNIQKMKRYTQKINDFINALTLRQQMFDCGNPIIFASARKTGNLSKLVIRKLDNNQSSSYVVELTTTSTGYTDLQQQVKQFCTLAAKYTDYDCAYAANRSTQTLTITINIANTARNHYPILLPGMIDYSAWITPENIADIDPTGQLMSSYNNSVLAQAISSYHVNSAFTLASPEDLLPKSIHESSQSPNKLQIVSVGNSQVGKTAFWITLVQGRFPADYVHAAPMNGSCNMLISGKGIELNVQDPNGSEDYDRLRPRSYAQTDVFLICYNITDRASLTQVKNKWVLEIQHFCPNTPFILIGLKNDLRDDPNTQERLRQRNESVITEQEGQEVAREIGAHSHILVSSLAEENIFTPIEHAVHAVNKKINLASAHRQPIFELNTNDPDVTKIIQLLAKAADIAENNNINQQEKALQNHEQDVYRNILALATTCQTQRRNRAKRSKKLGDELSANDYALPENQTMQQLVVVAQAMADLKGSQNLQHSHVNNNNDPIREMLIADPIKPSLNFRPLDQALHQLLKVSGHNNTAKKTYKYGSAPLIIGAAAVIGAVAAWAILTFGIGLDISSIVFKVAMLAGGSIGGIIGTGFWKKGLHESHAWHAHLPGLSTACILHRDVGKINRSLQSWKRTQ